MNSWPCGDIRSESNSTYLGSNERIALVPILKLWNYPDTYQLKLWIIAKAPHLSPSPDFIPYHVPAVETALSSYRFWLKSLGWYFVAHKRESKLIVWFSTASTIWLQIQLPPLARQIGLLLPWGHTTCIPPPCLAPQIASAWKILYFPFTYQNSIYLTNSGQVFPSSLKLAPTTPVIFPSQELISLRIGDYICNFIFGIFELLFYFWWIYTLPL